MRPPTAADIPCMCASLRRATRAVTRMYDEALAPVGLRATQFTLLLTLDAAGALRQHQVADVLSADSTTLSRTLAPLKRYGWLVDKTGDDLREKIWSLTPAGRRKLKEAAPLWESAQERMRHGLNKAEWTSLRALLEKANLAAA